MLQDIYVFFRHLQELQYQISFTLVFSTLA